MDDRRCVGKVTIFNRVGTCNHGNEPDCGEYYGRKKQLTCFLYAPYKTRGCTVLEPVLITYIRTE